MNIKGISKYFSYDRCGIVYGATAIPIYKIKLQFRFPFIYTPLDSVEILKWYCDGKEVEHRDVVDSASDNIPCEAYEYFEYEYNRKR